MAVSKWLNIYNLRPTDDVRYYVKSQPPGNAVPLTAAWNTDRGGWYDFVNNDEENLSIPEPLTVAPFWEFPWYREI